MDIECKGQGVSQLLVETSILNSIEENKVDILGLPQLYSPCE